MVKSPTPFLAMAALLLLASCQGSDSPMEPELDVPVVPRASILSMDCQINEPGGCETLKRGIDVMVAHANVVCAALGSLALDRYNAPPGEGFRDQPQHTTLHMSVYVHPNGQPMDGYTNVYPRFWDASTNPYIGSDISTGALIVHEEMHHWGYDEAQGAAMQETCMNPQA